MAKIKKIEKEVVKSIGCRVHNLDTIDIKLIKLSTAFWIFFLMTVWPWFNNLIFGVHWAFWLVVAILVMIRPLKRYFSK